MATFYLRTRTGLACKQAGQKHALYIAGKDRYADKNEVVCVLDKHLPAWAKNADEFFTHADKNERANGRSYRSIVFAIPNEATDKVLWAQAFTEMLVNEQHAYRLAVHLPANGHNPHAHLMFTERGCSDLPAETYFGRKNAKNKTYSGTNSRQWLGSAKQHYLASIRTLCPNYLPPNRGEPKVGAKLMYAHASYAAQRQFRAAKVAQLRSDEIELNAIDKAITNLPRELVTIFAESEKQPPSRCTMLNFEAFNPALSTDRIELIREQSADFESPAQHRKYQ